MKTDIERLKGHIDNLERGLALAEDCLSSISKDSFSLLTNHSEDLEKVDIHDNVYRINQKAHVALAPIRNYCLPNVKRS